MKNLKSVYLFTCLSFAGLLYGCDNEDEGPKPETIDFTATFFTERGNPLTPCGTAISETNFWVQEHQIGDGTATELGEFTTEMTFCIHFITDEDGNILPTEEGFGEYGDGVGEFIGENGDKITFTIPEGRVKLSSNPDYVFEFQDKIIIDGGTGAFEGATGELVSDSYVGADGIVDHDWSGEITIVRQ